MSTVRCSGRRGGVYPEWGVSTGGVYPGEVSVQGVCPGGSARRVSAQGVSVRGWGVCIPACTEADTPPVNRILDTRLWKYYLADGSNTFKSGGKNGHEL